MKITEKMIDAILKDTYKEFYKENSNILEKNLDKIVQDLLTKEEDSTEIMILKIAITKALQKGGLNSSQP